MQAVHQHYGNGYIQEAEWDNADNMILMAFVSTKQLPGGQTYNSLTVGKAGIKAERPSKNWVRKNRKVDLVTKYMPLARRIAYDMGKKTGDMDDVQAAAFEGLVLAAENFEDRGHGSFPLYARERIRGAVLDYWRVEARNLGWNNQEDAFWETLVEVDYDKSRNDMIETISEAVTYLRPRRRRTIQARYLQSGEPVSWKELAEEFNVTPRRVADYRADGLRDLKEVLWREFSIDAAGDMDKDTKFKPGRPRNEIDL